MKATNGERIFNVFNVIILGIAATITLYPFIYILAVSFSDPLNVNMGNVWIYPKGFNLDSYAKALERPGLILSYANSFFYMVVGTIISLVVTILGAYPLSKKRLMGKKWLNLAIVFTMWFNAGLVPIYLNLKDLHLLDTRWAILLMSACNAYNFILMRTYFMSLPDALEEACKIDGASDFQILRHIYVPLSMPTIATITLFYGIAQWNNYLWPMLVLNDESKIPLQVVLKKFVTDMTTRLDQLEYGVDAVNLSEEGIIYSTMVLSILPMVIIYPFIQRFFVKGIILGSVKG